MSYSCFFKFLYLNSPSSNKLILRVWNPIQLGAEWGIHNKRTVIPSKSYSSFLLTFFPNPLDAWELELDRDDDDKERRQSSTSSPIAKTTVTDHPLSKLPFLDAFSTTDNLAVQEALLLSLISLYINCKGEIRVAESSSCPLESEVRALFFSWLGYILDVRFPQAKKSTQKILENSPLCLFYSCLYDDLKCLGLLGDFK